MALSKDEQRICDLATQIATQEAKVAGCNSALVGTQQPTADDALQVVIQLRSAIDKLNAARTEYKQRAHEYLTERMNNTTLTKVLGLNTNAAPMGKS